jgi:hypothetical protein
MPYLLVVGLPILYRDYWVHGVVLAVEAVEAVPNLVLVQAVVEAVVDMD